MNVKYPTLLLLNFMLATLVGMLFMLYVTAAAQSGTDVVTVDTPPLSFTNTGAVISHDTKERSFIFDRLIYPTADGNGAIPTKLIYDEKTTFIRQITLKEDDTVSGLRHEYADAETVLASGNDVLVFYTTGSNNALRAFYVMSGSLLFAR